MAPNNDDDDLEPPEEERILDEDPETPAAAPPGVSFSLATGQAAHAATADHRDDDNDENNNNKKKKSGGGVKLTPTPSMKRIVETKDEITVSFDNLTVHLAGIDDDDDNDNKKGGCCCSCCSICSNRLVSPLATYAVEYLGVAVEHRPSQYALTNVSGRVKTGEMVLVLSTDALYASTLLQAVTGRLNSNNGKHVTTTLTGAVCLNGVPLSTEEHWQGWRRRAPHVLASDASHAPILTVRETVLFAAQCTSDGTETGDAQHLTTRVDRILAALDLTHVQDTVVGDENLRGVSGGQKRRVTVAEMLTDRRAAFLGLEHITDGLSSTDSLSLVAQLQQCCRQLRMAALVSLLQPSDEIVALFDKLMVLGGANGDMLYFGPVDDRQALREVFLGPDADYAAEDRGSICDLVLGHSLEKKNNDNDGDDGGGSEAVLRRFQASPAYKSLMEETAQLASSSQQQQEQDISHLLPQQKYAAPAWYQAKVIARRRLKLIARNAVTYTRIGIAVVFGVIIGSLFSELNNDLIGSLSRTGYMFLHCFLVLMLSAAITIPQTFRERVTLFKHRSAEFYSGRVAYATGMLLDIPLSIVEATLLASISYFWVDMKPGANHFFYFLGTLIGLEFFGQAFGRLLCAVVRKQVSANTFSSIFLLIFGTVAGFMPGYEAIHPVLQWLSWITPASYAFEGLMINEFYSRNISAVVLATDDGTVDIGNLSGAGWVNNFGLPRAEWGSPDDIKLFDIMMLFIGSFIVDLFGCYFVEHTRAWFFNQMQRPQRKTKSKTFTQSGSTTPADKMVASNKGKALATDDWPQSLSVKDLCYYVNLPGKARPKRLSVQSILGPCLAKLSCKDLGQDSSHRDSLNETSRELRLLNGVDATFQRGRITALMGTRYVIGSRCFWQQYVSLSCWI